MSQQPNSGTAVAPAVTGKALEIAQELKDQINRAKMRLDIAREDRDWVLVMEMAGFLLGAERIEMRIAGLLPDLMDKPKEG